MQLAIHLPEIGHDQRDWSTLVHGQWLWFGWLVRDLEGTQLNGHNGKVQGKRCVSRSLWPKNGKICPSSHLRVIIADFDSQESKMIYSLDGS